jgi:hypothetical protein
MTLQIITFGLISAIIPFTFIFLFITIAWALIDLSLRNVSASRRMFWTLAVIALPLAGPVAYNYLVRRTTGFKRSSVFVPGLGTAGELCEARE